MYLKYKPANGKLYGMLTDKNETQYDIYLVKRPTVLQKIYYRKWSPSFYVIVKCPSQKTPGRNWYAKNLIKVHPTYDVPTHVPVKYSFFVRTTNYFSTNYNKHNN